MRSQTARADDKPPGNVAKPGQGNPKRVLHVMGTADSKGAAVCRLVESLALATDPARYQIQACFLEKGEFTDQFLHAGIESTCVHWDGKASQVMGALRYATLLRSARFSIIHQHVGGRLLTGMGRYLTRAKIVFHLHGRASEQTGEVPADCSLPPHDLLIANSETVARYANDPDARVVYPGVIGTGLPTTRSAHRGIVIGTACRLELIKGIDNLIEAFAQLAVGREDLRLEIAGDGSLRKSLEEQSRRLGVSACISFLGWRDDLNLVMAGWDVFVLPSLDEGFGVAVLEAMAAGLPVVASAVGGLCELVVDGETGFLVPPSVPAELAARMDVLIKDGQRREAMGTAGRKRALERFSMSQMIEQTFAIYDELLSS